MSDAPDIGEVEPEEERPVFSRDRDLLGRKTSKIRDELAKVFDSIKTGFENQANRSDEQDDYWACYNCELNSNQFYNGNAEIYLPLIHDAIEARVTRFSNQLFPQGGRCVEAISSDGSTNAEIIALIDHYMGRAKAKTMIVQPLLRNGDVEGHYNLYCDWGTVERQIVSRETHGPMDPETGQEGPGADIEDVKEEDIIEGRPMFEVLHDCDVLVLPATADTIEEALADGGSVTIVRRWSKAKIERMAENGDIRDDEAKRLIETMGKVTQNDHNVEKGLADYVGIIKKGKEAVVWETWACLKLNEKGEYSEKGKMRLCRVYFGPEEAQLGCKRNPYWNDRCPLLSAAVKKMSGVFKGPSMIKIIASMQYEANDAINQGADAAAYSALPIIARDPEKADGPMVLNLAAIWDIPPDSVQFMTFPDLTPRALTRVESAKQAIFQTLGVNPSMIPQQTGRPGAKRNQAEIAMEQSVDLLTTAEGVSVFEESIGTPMAEWAIDLDYQFRDNDLTVRMFGELGYDAIMQEVGPLQNRNGFTYIWRGASQVRQNAMMMQQGTGWLNVLKGMRQELAAEGMQIRLGPMVEAGTLNIFGPHLASKIIVDQRHQLTLDPALEVEMMLEGFETHPHPLDNDQEKIAAFRQAMVESGDLHGTIRVRLQMQLKQMQAKAQAVMMQKMQQMMQAQGGGGPPPGGGPRGPQPGAAPAGPRLLRGPPGNIHRDQLPRAGAVGMPRKM